jgi:hypothetical protein
VGLAIHDAETLANTTETILTGVRAPKRTDHAISGQMVALRLRRPNTVAKRTSESRFSALCIQLYTGNSRMVSHRGLGRSVAGSRSGRVRGVDVLR